MFVKELLQKKDDFLNWKERIDKTSLIYDLKEPKEYPCFLIWTTKNFFTRFEGEHCLNYANYDFIYKDDVKCLIKDLLK